MPEPFKWLIGFLLVGLIVFCWFRISYYESHGTNVAFQSSDGNWADQEVLTKFRDFKAISFYFELYKIKCNAPNASLQRVTDRPGMLSVTRWFDDYSATKWNVPLAQQHDNFQNINHLPPDQKHCRNRAVSEDEIELARELSSAFLSALM